MDSWPKSGDGRRLMFRAAKPHFFKIILDDTIRRRKLGIPRKFARRYGSEMSSPVFLKVPSGEKWEVQLVKCDDEIWLTNGWQEFVGYYSLACGYFLVFEFEQNCHFNVIIMDKSSSEIDYPLSHNEDTCLEEEFPGPKVEETESDHSLPSPLPFTQPHKKLKLEKPTKNIKSLCLTKQSEGKRGKAKETGRMQPLTAEEKANALHRAGANFKSGNPYFMIVMQQTHLHRLNIPASFKREHFNNRKAATFITKEEKAWFVEFVSIGKAIARSRDGWKKFVQENHLEVGDVCVFELINRIACKFNVVIFRHT
ncbi:hypothetical protein MANES_07G115300v8 [Manihot esculenta]|uniref:Uncharacterized protein n=1 Tax=Manihot esculenta TaxID=3983 RepID=A0ACB7HGE9_MANES|nr:hypothetical protein MANES_07G115300v8 [Manihot esculenta]